MPPAEDGQGDEAPATRADELRAQLRQLYQRKTALLDQVRELDEQAVKLMREAHDHGATDTGLGDDYGLYRSTVRVWRASGPAT